MEDESEDEEVKGDEDDKGTKKDREDEDRGDDGTGESVSAQHDVAKGNSDDDWSLSMHMSTLVCIATAYLI